MIQMTSPIEMRCFQGKATMIVCVETLCNGRPQGNVFNPYLPEGIPFSGIDGLVLCVNRICDKINYPQAAFELRSLTKNRVAEPKRITEESGNMLLDQSLLLAQHGKHGTLSITVLYRQHGGLQGQIVMNRGQRLRKRCFRSGLELMALLDEAFPISSADQ